MWCWNGMPADARGLGGFLAARGPDALGLGGGAGKTKAGRLFIVRAKPAVMSGSAELALRTWYHVVWVRDDAGTAVYLNGKPDVFGEWPANVRPGGYLWIGSDGTTGWEGKIADVAYYDRPLSADEIIAHYRAANLNLIGVP
jgi:hypothetical protein